MSDETDSSLVQEALNGGEQAFSCLVRRYQSYAYGVAAMAQLLGVAGQEVYAATTWDEYNPPGNRAAPISGTS